MAKVQRKLGELLMEARLITQEQLDECLDVQKTTRELLGQILVAKGYVMEKDVIRMYAKQQGVYFVDLSKMKVSASVAKAIPSHLCQRHKVLALNKDDKKVVLAMANPLDIFAIDDVKLVTGLDVQPVIAMPSEIDQLVSKFFSVDESTKEALEAIKRMGMDPDALDDGLVSEMQEEDDDVTTKDLLAMTEDNPVVKLVNAIIVEAVKQGASDIHIEPQKEIVRVRYRVDGVLHKQMTPPKKVSAGIASRVKVLSDLNIAERRIPQDGRINLKIEHKEYDFRVSTYPTQHGEKIVMRILDRSNVNVPISALGMLGGIQEKFERLVEQPVGMFLVTGPTGSGKSTTLYSALNKLNTPDVAIYTVEDPVEYQIEGLNQVMVNPKAGLFFANTLRSFLRHDPDIIMVGEIRDFETAEIAIQAALTGHLVLSTLHTNDAPSAATRLVDMGVEPFLVSSSLIGALAQRLVRKLCPVCRDPYQPDRALLRRLHVPEELSDELVFYKAKGCEDCSGKGYRGRTGVHELITVDDVMKDMFVDRAPSMEVKKYCTEVGMDPLQTDAVKKIMQGVTSVEEAMRVVYVD